MANIQSGIGKLHCLEQQFLHGGVNVVLIQEAKAKRGMIKSRNYLRYDSDSDGNCGCAIWISRTLPTGTLDGKPYLVQESDVAIVSDGPRHIVAKISMSAACLVLASIHWPAQTRPAKERVDFAAMMSATLEKVADIPGICGMDGNARVPQCVNGVTGELLCGEADQAGYDLVHILSTVGMLLPSTFLRETWTHATGKRSRIDYPAVTQHFSLGDMSTRVAEEIDLLTVAEDHQAVELVACLRVLDSRDVPPAVDRRKKFDARKLALPEVRDEVEGRIEAMGLRLIPWGMNVNDHTQIVQDSLLQILSSVAPHDLRGPYSSYITQETWALRERKQSLKRRTGGDCQPAQRAESHGPLRAIGCGGEACHLQDQGYDQVQRKLVP